MLKNRKILVVVPARGGSRGIPLKNIKKVLGIPLVALVGQMIKDLSYIDRAIVSTDHFEIANISKKYGLQVPFMRPKDLSGDRISDWQVLDHALRTIERIDQTVYDIIVLLPLTSPCRQSKYVTQTINKLIHGNFDSVWSISQTDSKSHPFKQYFFENDSLDFYDKQGEKIIARQQLKPVYHCNGVSYVMTRECILEQKTTKGQKSSAVIIPGIMINIDTPYDLMLAEFVLKNRLSNDT